MEQEEEIEQIEQINPNELESESFQSSPVISEKRLWNMNNVFIAVFIGILIVILFIVILFVTTIDTLYKVLIASALVIAYAIILFFLLEPKLLREIKHTELRTQTPIIKEIVVEKPVQIIHETEKPIYYVNPKKTLNIPKYEFVGSSQTKTYHKKNCRLGKLIKKKFKIMNNNEGYFTKNKYKPCQVCILKNKKI